MLIYNNLSQLGPIVLNDKKTATRDRNLAPDSIQATNLILNLFNNNTKYVGDLIRCQDLLKIY